MGDVEQTEEASCSGSSSSKKAVEDVQRCSTSGGVKSSLDKDDKPSGKNFTDTFKNILSSVLKTDLGLVLKNRNDKNNANKTSSDSSKSTSPLPPLHAKSTEADTEQAPKVIEGATNFMSAIVTRASSKSQLNEGNGDSKPKKEVIKSESEGASEIKNGSINSKLAKPNRARKSVPKTVQDVIQNEEVQEKQNVVSQVEKPNTRRSSRNVYSRSLVRTSTGKKKKNRFKGGTYHLGIKPKKKKKVQQNSSKPTSENTSVDDNSEDANVSLANLDDTSEDMSVRIECEVINDEAETVADKKVDSANEDDDDEDQSINEKSMNDAENESVQIDETETQPEESLFIDKDLLSEGSSVKDDDKTCPYDVSVEMERTEENGDGSLEHCKIEPSELDNLHVDMSVSSSSVSGDNVDEQLNNSAADELEVNEQPRSETSDSSGDANESLHLDPTAMNGVDESGIKQEYAEEHDANSNHEPVEEASDYSALRDVTEEDRNMQNQIVENGECDSSERSSIASSVKRLHGSKRKREEICDFDSEIPQWVLNDQSPKRAKKAMTSNIVKNEVEVVDEQLQASEEPEVLLCTCQEMCTPSPNVSNSKQMFCQALDSVDDRLMGCCNVVKRPLLNRSSHVVPFVALCEIHRSRLRAHHCCPRCGVFCTQGQFVKCNDATSKAWHLFHERCCLVSNGQGLCPHCGLATEWIRIRLRISMSKPLVIFPKQQQTDKLPSARMSMIRSSEFQEPDVEEDSKQYKIPSTGKEITLAGLPVGPDRAQLESMLVNLAIEKPMNLRYTIKSMYNAAKSNDVEKIFHMLAMGFDPNHKFDEHDNETAVHAACAAGHLVMVHVLHQAGAYLDVFDNKLRTPLMLAVENKQMSVLQYLLHASVHLEARGEDGMTVLHLAAKAGHLEGCCILLQSGQINVNILDDGGWTPVVWAAEHRHKEVVRYLLDHGSDPNIRDNEQNIALHWAAFSGGLDVCEMLLNRGCDVCSINEHGDTPLHIAARQDNYDCVILFLARGADIEVRNKENDTPLTCCPDETTQTGMALSMNMKLKWFAKCRITRVEVMLHKDASMGKEQIAIPCMNGADDESFPTDYLYITENCETSPMNVDRSIVALQNCQCMDDCSSVLCSCSALSLKCWYTKDGGLVPEFNLLDPPMIFECNRACRCWKNCNNRVVQHGITARLQLYRTQGKGWGVRTLRDIPRGTFICEYIGELISDSEADHREDDSYLFDLDNRDGETYCIDARYYGNIARFINHLCEPNLVPVKVFIDHQDLRFPRIAFFSSRDIKAYEELGFDYGEKFWIIKYKTFTCMCDAERCKYSADKIQEMLENYMRRQREEIEMNHNYQRVSEGIRCTIADYHYQGPWYSL